MHQGTLTHVPHKQMPARASSGASKRSNLSLEIADDAVSMSLPPDNDIKSLSRRPSEADLSRLGSGGRFQSRQSSSRNMTRVPSSRGPGSRNASNASMTRAPSSSSMARAPSARSVSSCSGRAARDSVEKEARPKGFRLISPEGEEGEERGEGEEAKPREMSLLERAKSTMHIEKVTSEGGDGANEEEEDAGVDVSIFGLSKTLRVLRGRTKRPVRPEKKLLALKVLLAMSFVPGNSIKMVKRMVQDPLLHMLSLPPKVTPKDCGVSTEDMTGLAVRIVANLAMPPESHTMLADVACCMALMRSLARSTEEALISLRALLNLSSTHAVHMEMLSPRVELIKAIAGMLKPSVFEFQSASNPPQYNEQQMLALKVVCNLSGNQEPSNIPCERRMKVCVHALCACDDCMHHQRVLTTRHSGMFLHSLHVSTKSIFAWIPPQNPQNDAQTNLPKSNAGKRGMHTAREIIPLHEHKLKST